MKESRINAIFSFFYFVGLIVIAFIMGAIVIRYGLPPSRSLINGFIAAEAYIKALDEAEQDQEVGKKIREELAGKSESNIQNPKVTWNEKKAFNGYTLISTGYLSTPILVDMNGKIVYRWNVPIEKVWSSAIGCTNIFRVGVYFVDRAHLFPNGDMIAQYADAAAPYGCGIIKVDKDSNILWSYKGFVHHDSFLTKSGEIYTLIQKTIVDSIPGFEQLPYPFTADDIVKISSGGKEEMRISIIDALIGTPYELIMLHKGDGDGDDKFDLFHTNSIDVLSAEDAAKFPMFKTGQILVSMRALSTLAVIDPVSKKVIWAYHGFWRYQHAASFLPNGHILLLDNQGHTEEGGKHSRVLEFNPATLGIEWSYIGTKEHPFTTSKVGRLQRLPNGNTLINESQNARIFEVTPKGDIVWSYKLEKRNNAKHDYSDATFNTMRYTAAELPFLKDSKEAPPKK